MISHPIPPVFDGNAAVLVLGSFPSAASRETGFFYGHPQNRFWRVLAALWDERVPVDIPEKIAFLHTHGIALFDVLAACEITGSADATIQNETPADLAPIFAAARIGAVFTNGKTAYALWRRYQQARWGEVTPLPSTSPANAAWSLPRLVAAWRPLAAAANAKNK